MDPNTQLSPHVKLSDLPCYELATPSDVDRVQLTLAFVIEPVWTRFGKVEITSWKWWHDQGCAPRTGPHSGGGTLDFVPLEASISDVFEWGNKNIVPKGYVGRWIMGPPNRNHIHVASVADMMAVDGLSDISAWVENPEGKFTAVPGLEGTSGAPSGDVGGLSSSNSTAWVKLFAVGSFVGVLILVHRKNPDSEP